MNDYTLYLVKRAYYKKQLIKRAGNPINKLKLKTFKGLTDSDYLNKSISGGAAELSRRGLASDAAAQSLLNDAVESRNNVIYGQPTIPDDVLANPGQALRDRGLDKAFGNNDLYMDMLRMRRNGKLLY